MAVAKKTRGEVLADQWRAGVDGDASRTRPPGRVDVMVLDARRMAKFGHPLAAQLRAVKVDPALPEAVKILSGRLEDVELDWQQSRKAALGAKRARQREELEELKRRTLATCRFLWRADARAQARLEAISEGDGSLADLISDARALAKELRRDPGVAALDRRLRGADRKLDALAEALSEQPETPEAELFQERNRLAAALKDAMDELAAALDFITRDAPEKRRQYAPTVARRAAVRPPVSPPAEEG